MRNCQRCLTGEVSWTADTSLLIGGVAATLCNACQTEWTSAVQDSPAWRRRLVLDARQAHYKSLAQAGMPVSEAEWAALLGDQCDSEKEFHAIAVEFVRPVPSPVTAVERDD
jgi:hypothetical protein